MSCQQLGFQALPGVSGHRTRWAGLLESGQRTTRVTLPLRHCGTPYQGINILLLWGEAVAKGYRSGRWMTYRHGVRPWR
jgi:antirestriction protein ArdC